MSSEQAVDPNAAEALSALMDGEVQDADEVAQGCRAWREHARLRESWHRYHLIGDVLRSDDLAGTGARDAAFLRQLRGRLAAEPVVLAPTSRPAVVRQRRWRWAAPAAVAAGFVAVAGVLVVTRTPVAEPAAVPVANAPIAAPVVPVAKAEADTEPALVPVQNSQMLRDAQLDRYLDAHQQFARSTALGAAGLLRRATAEAAGR